MIFESETMVKAADKEDMTLDEFIALALAGQISSWNTGEVFTERAAKGDWQKAREILANAPNIETEDCDEL